MESFWRRSPLRPGEAGLALTLGLILFSNYAAMGVTKVISVSGFLNEVRDHFILLVWAVDMLLLILATGLQSLIVDRFDRVKLISGVLLFFAVLYALLPLIFTAKFIPHSIGYTLIYLLNDQQWRFFPVVFWILVNDVYDPATGRRILPVIAVFAFFGTIVGLAIAAVDAELKFGTVNLLLLNSSIFVAAFLLSRAGLRKVRIATATRARVSMVESFAEGWTFIRTVPAFAYLAVSMLAAGSVMTILLFDVLSDAKLELGNGFQAFYARYNLVIAVVSIFVQGISARLIERISLKRSFLFQPFVMLASMISNFVFPGYAGSAVSQGVARVSYDTLDLSARKSFQALVPNEKRGRVSMFIDSYLPSGGTIVGSLLSFLIIYIGMEFGMGRETYTLVYLGVGVLLSILAVSTAFRLQSTYDQTLLNWQLKRRTRGASVLDKLDFSDKQES